MPVATHPESDLLLIEGLEIDPLPDALFRNDAMGTSDGEICCSMEQCSTTPPEEGMCSCDACSGGPRPKECTWLSFVYE